MPADILSQIKDLSPTVVGYLILGYLCYLLINALNSAQNEHYKFIEENNHKNADRMDKNTEVLVEVKESIRENTNAIRELMLKK